ncbi:hypothetical protein RHSIM_Rhsim10G0085100 [Rhododendron simsii]|uniref:Uncharacterized protein n=1 Tax=Rhododendron simsii TaxID=118357 RepID=A0A834GAX8_RHOSS|nr:hypothetical protein RHSIM_Rhsim10G0085100 [Rhododendron simsii]
MVAEPLVMSDEFKQMIISFVAGEQWPKMKILNSLPKLTYTVEFANKFSNCKFFDGILHRKQNPIIATVWPWQILQLLSNLLCFVRCYLMAMEVMWFSDRGRHPTVAARSGRFYCRRQWRRHWDSTRVKPLDQLQPKPFGYKEEDEPPHMTAFCSRRLRQQLHLRQKALATPSHSSSSAPRIASPLHRQYPLLPPLLWANNNQGRRWYWTTGTTKVDLLDCKSSAIPSIEESSAVAASTKTLDHGRSDVVAASSLIHKLF